MRKNSVALLCFLIAAHITLLAQDERNFIEWRTTKLTWNDFNGNVPAHALADAMTSSGIYFSFDIDGETSVNITIISQFDKTKSWVKPVGKLPEVLCHEQLHFDISELHAQMLRKFFKEQTFTDKMNLKIMLKRYYNEYMQKLNRMQNDYDNQTENGTNKPAQKSWQSRIEKEMLKLENFREASFVVLLKK